MNVLKYLTFTLVVHLYSNAKINCSALCGLCQISTAFTSGQISYLICDDIVWKYDYRRRAVERDSIRFTDLFVGSPATKPDAIFAIPSTDRHTNDATHPQLTQSMANLTFVFQDTNYWVYRPALDGKFYRQLSDYGLPKELKSVNGHISDWIGRDRYSIPEYVTAALYADRDYRIYLFVRPRKFNNITYYPYYYNEKPAREPTDGIRLTATSAHTVHFDAAFLTDKSPLTAIFLRADNYCYSSVETNNFLTRQCNWRDSSELFANCPTRYATDTAIAEHVVSDKSTLTSKHNTVIKHRANKVRVSATVATVESSETVLGKLNSSETGNKSPIKATVRGVKATKENRNHFFLFLIVFVVLILSVFLVFLRGICKSRCRSRYGSTESYIASDILGDNKLIEEMSRNEFGSAIIQSRSESQ